MIEYLNGWIAELNDNVLYGESPETKDNFYLKYNNEYLTLYKGGKIVTQGESEVVDRIKYIARENYIDLPDLDKESHHANDFY